MLYGIKDGVIRCWQCGPAYSLCSTCDIEVHTTYVLHNRDAWNWHFFKSIPPTDMFDERTNEVFSADIYIYIYVTGFAKGFFHTHAIL